MELFLQIGAILGAITAAASVITFLVRSAKAADQMRRTRKGAAQWTGLDGGLIAAPPPTQVVKEARLAAVRPDCAQVISEIVATFISTGVHAGQFGWSQQTDEVERFLQPGEFGSEKPKLYLTYWAVAILSNHSPFRDLPVVAAAITRTRIVFESVMSSGGVRATAASTLAVEPTGHLEQVVSLRHSIAAANVLFCIDHRSIAASKMAGRMLQRPSEMTDSDGGWLLVEQGYREPDLWSSAYAVKFLCDVLLSNLPLMESERARAVTLVRASLNSLGRHLGPSGWPYGKASPAENGVLIAIEIGPACRSWDAALAQRIRTFLIRCCPNRELAPWYLLEAGAATALQSAIRMAYAMMRCGLSPEVYPTLLDEVADRPLTDSELAELNAMELAALLDLKVRRNGALGPD